MGMFDYVTFDKSYKLPGTYQTKSLDQLLCKIHVGKKEFRVDGKEYRDPAVIEARGDSGDIVHVVANNGIVLGVIKYTIHDPILLDRAICPSCQSIGTVYSLGSDIECGSCKSKLELAAVK